MSATGPRTKAPELAETELVQTELVKTELPDSDDFIFNVVDLKYLNEIDVDKYYKCCRGYCKKQYAKIDALIKHFAEAHPGEKIEYLDKKKTSSCCKTFIELSVYINYD